MLVLPVLGLEPRGRARGACVPRAGLLQGGGLQTAPFHAPRLMEPKPSPARMPLPHPFRSGEATWPPQAASGVESPRKTVPSSREAKGLHPGGNTSRALSGPVGPPGDRGLPADSLLESHRGGHTLRKQTRVWQLAQTE